MLWYVAYGSNLCLSRFRCYIGGGCPPGAKREYAGCRDRSDPLAVIGVGVPGRIYFAGTSLVWGGGMAFYDPESTGTVAARAYLITPGQFSDIVAQETRQEVGADLDLTIFPLSLVTTTHYRRVLHLGELDGLPMVTLTSDGHSGSEWTKPSAEYLSMISAGLFETYGWDSSTIGAYLERASASLA